MAKKRGEEDDLHVRVTTITGSITGKKASMNVRGSLSVHEFKLLVQGMEGTRPQQRGPSSSKSKTVQGVSPDFQRVFFDGHEITDEESTLDECGVKEDSVLSFAVSETLGKKLRSAMRRVGSDFSEHGDCAILGSVLKDLKGRILIRENSTKLNDELCLQVFNTKFHKFKDVHSGFLTLDNIEGGEKSNYVHWPLFEKVEGAFPFKTYYGIPVCTRLHGRKKQHLIGEVQPHSLIVHQRNYYEVAAPGYFGPEGRRMACTAMPATSKKGDSNAVWSTPGGRIVGIHSSGDDADGSMSVVRLDTSQRRHEVEPCRQSKRLASSGDGELEPETKKQNTGKA